MKPMRIVVLNPCLVATPLNFRKWLREKLTGYEKAGVVGGETVTGILFLERTYKGQLGSPTLKKIISGAISRHKWLSAVEVITTEAPISDADAEAVISQIQADYRIQEQLRAFEEADDLPEDLNAEVEHTWLGYLPSATSADGHLDIEKEPACVVRLARESDFEDVLKNSSAHSLGDWFVLGTPIGGGSVELSQAYSDEATALSFAKTTYGVSIFKTPMEVQALQLQAQVDILSL